MTMTPTERTPVRPVKVQSTPGAPEVEADRLAVIYETGSGRVVHLHRLTTLRGGRARSDDDLVATALDHAGRASTSLRRDHVAVLVVTPDAIREGHSHRVDVVSRTLRATPRPTTA